MDRRIVTSRTTTSDLALPVQTYYDQVLLSVATPHTIHSMGSTKKSMKGKKGDVLRMERYNRLDTATVPLGNSGVNPPGQRLSSVFIDAKIQFYGTYVEINEQLPILSSSPVMNQATIRLGQSMRETEDELMKNMLMSSAASHECTGGVNGDAPTELTLSDIQEVVRTLKSADAQTMSSSIDASDKFGTAPVADAYFGLGHTDLSSTLSQMPNFLRTHQYGTQSGIKSSEWGSIDGVRFFLSSRGAMEKDESANGNDVYYTFVCGMDAYSNVELDNYKSQMVYRDAKTAGGPLALNQTVGWKMAEAPVIKNDSWVLKVKSTLLT